MGEDLASHTVWANGEIMAGHAATVSVLDHGFLYGDGVFEGVRYYNGAPFRLTAHLERLFDSARSIQLTVPYEQATMVPAVQKTIQRSGLRDGYLRIIVSRGEGALGLDPRSCKRPNVFIIAGPLSFLPPAVYENGARVIIAATRRLPVAGLDPRIKSLNYLNHILARLEANAADADEALLLNERGYVAEGTADNLFIVKKGEIRTPRTADGALAGITRELVIHLAAEAGIPVKEMALAPYDLHTADECFLCGTGAELIPVGTIGGHTLAACPGPVFSAIRERFEQTVRMETSPGVYT